jgi:GH35 family endo-1,4-beta-xylanase
MVALFTSFSIQELLDQGAPISGIGVQGHFGGNDINIAKVGRLVHQLT